MPSTIALARPRTAALDPYSQTSLVNELAVPGRTYCCAPRSRLLATAPCQAVGRGFRFAARQLVLPSGPRALSPPGNFPEVAQHGAPAPDRASKLEVRAEHVDPAMTTCTLLRRACLGTFALASAFRLNAATPLRVGSLLRGGASMSTAAAPQEKFRLDYTAPPYRIDRLSLDFDIYPVIQ